MNFWKAASNALELMNRWPEPVCPEGWVTTLASVARDEAAHLNSVTRLLSQRGGKLERLHKNPYAHDLRRLVRKGAGVQELLDRLLVSALLRRVRASVSKFSRGHARMRS